MSVLIVFSLTLLTLASLHMPLCDAFSYSVLSATLPTRSYYLETSLSSNQLNPLAAGLGITSPVQINITSTTTSTDLSFTTTGTGIIAILSKDINPGSYCVIRVLDTQSSTIQQSGLACTIAFSTGLARIQAEPSSVTCGGLNPCKSSVVTKLDIDTAANNNNLQTQTQATDNMGASSTTIIIAAVSGAIGLVVLVIVIAWVLHSRQASYKNMKDTKSSNTTTSVMWASPPAVLAASSQQPQQTRGRGDTHVRTQTELNYAVNPMQYNVAVDIHEPALQLAPPTTHRYH